MKRIELYLIDHDEIRFDEFRFHPGDAVGEPQVFLESKKSGKPTRTA